MKTNSRKAIAFAAMLIAASTQGLTHAAPVEPTTAARVAANFMKSRTPQKSPIALSETPIRWEFDGMYLFANPGGAGFVIVAADDAAMPIVGYSTSTSFSVERMPVQLHTWLEGYQHQMEALRATNATATAAIAAQWRDMEAGRTKPSGKNGVGPLITSHWDQQEPYNELCPTDSLGTCPTGCAATAQAMMMRYWSWPPFGVGSHSYDAEKYGILHADFNLTDYDWEHMIDRPNRLSAEEVRTAIATLMSHVGISLNMYYTPSQSGALGFDDGEGAASINNSLKRYFHYNKDMWFIDKSNFSGDDAWRDTLIGELDQRHPILYTGSDTYGGHAFICDGYDDDKRLHFNFGWSGMGDGFYYVGDITPNTGGVGGNATGTFNMQNMALLGAYPDPNPLPGESTLYVGRDGGSDSLRLYLGNDDAWTATCSDSWITLSDTAFRNTGWMVVATAPNTSGVERTGYVTITQGQRQTRVGVVQDAFTDDERCPITLIMRTSGPANWGWRGGAYISMETLGGRSYIDISIRYKQTDTVVVNVNPKDLVVKWHGGGNTDRLASYSVVNQYGETVVDVANALEDGGRHLVPWPCGHADISEAEEPTLAKAYPNPTSGLITIDAAEPVTYIVSDVTGRTVAAGTGSTVDITTVPAGVYFLRINSADGLTIKKILKQ